MSIIYLKKILKIFRALLILSALCLFFWLFLKDFVPSGILVVKNDFEFKDKQISDLYPDVRVRQKQQNGDGDWYQDMYVDPVYFKVNPPREFKRVKLRIKYKIERQPFFQVGLKSGPGELDFQFSPMEFEKLDDLDWYELRNEDLVLFQKSKRYNSIKEFLNNLPRDGRVAVYNMNLEIPSVRGYQSTVLNLKTDLNHVSYVIAKYKEPTISEEWKINEAEFEISKDNYFDGRLVFILSAPDIDLNRGDINISEIEVRLERPKFQWSNFTNEMGDYLKGVFD